MASVESVWTQPPAGTYDVAVGQSLSRALKARKGETVRSKVERELYSFRCEHVLLVFLSWLDRDVSFVLQTTSGRNRSTPSPTERSQLGREMRKT